MQDLLHIEHLAVTLGKKQVLSDVNLSVEPGEIVGLLGPNGAGKSTTIAAALGLLPPQSGTIFILGQNPREVPSNVYRDLGVLPEQNGFYDWMSGEDYLSFFARLRREDATPDHVANWLTSVGLSPRPGQRIGTYSRGMKQRLGLARALIGSPQLVILDEPTNGLDPRGRHEVHQLLRKLEERGTGVLMCTHLLDDVERLCRRVAIISEGCTVVEGTITELSGHANDKSRYRLRLAAPPPDIEQTEQFRVVGHEDGWWSVQLANGTDADLVWRDLFVKGWRILEIHSEDQGLESLYLSLTNGQERKMA